ncbi:FG-GAP-like repeat-containing protein [Reichenbachiella sp.]|uniref:FG-GAP-like repeat-containing protein n=1 Tax=Reichenbachiella sp. TaxID=2184521 RepID=UPI003B59CF60
MRKSNQMTKNIIVFALVLTFTLSASAQAPYINSISPTSAVTGQEINISGSNFTGATAVFFGGMQGDNMNVVNTNLITVDVPFGATFDQISVVHTNGIGYSPQKFTPTFDGQSIADGSTVLGNLSGQETFASSRTQTQDLCTCDLDGDGLLDMALTNAGSTDGLIWFKNTSTIGDANFNSPIVIENGFTMTNVVCGDLNGDGFSDLLGNQLGNEGSLYTYFNDGAGNFDAGEEWTLPTNGGLFRKPGRIAIADLDLDGLPEIIVATEDDNKVYYFKNTSTVGNINFNSTPVALSAPENSGTAGLGGLDVADLNNDGLPEIITSNFTEFGYYVFQNNSQPNTITFRDPLFMNTNSSIRTLIAGDLNNDGFADVVLTNSDISSSNVIEISANGTISAGGDITMTSPISILGIRQSWGVDLGDIDGDGDLDIIVGSEIENGFYAVMNTNPSSIAAASYSVGLVAGTNLNNARNIKVADIDNDGRPDFAYTNNSKSTSNGNLGTRLNEICFVPVIRPSGSTTLCENESVDLVAPTSGYNYVWKRGTTTLGETSNTLTLTEGVTSPLDGTYTVSVNNGCSTESNGLAVTAPGEALGIPTTSITDTPCEGDNVSLSASPGAGGTTVGYEWTGPNGFTSSDQNPTINNITAEHSGEYYVTAMSNAGCEKRSAVELVTVISTPVVSVNNPKPDYFCNGTTLDLSTNNFAGYTYAWNKNGAPIAPAETDPDLLEVNSAGDYSVTITGSGCSYTSAERTISAVTPPTSSFIPSDTIICEAVPVTFNATSTGESGLSIVNHWDFKDGSSVETGDALTHAFITAGTYAVTLTAKYDGIADADCTYTPADSTLTVRAAPTDVDLIISDNSDPNNFEKCRESSITLRLENNYETYAWRIENDTISEIAIAEVSVEVDVFVSLTDSIKCEFNTDPVSVSNYTTGGITISASSNTVEDDVDLGRIINMQEGQSSITLTVDNATEPAWEPAIYIDDTTATQVIVSASNKQLISVYGIDNLGCQEKDSVTLVFPGVNAAKSFTPNGDGIGDCWEVSNIGGTNCQVVIFDGKGRRIRELSFNPDSGADDCVWDGTKSNGSALPDGMYYYFISCSDSENESSGSIFMAR